MSFDDIFSVLEGAFAAEEMRDRIQKEIDEIVKSHDKIEGVFVVSFEGLPIAMAPANKYSEASPIFPSISVVHLTSERSLDTVVGEVKTSIIISDNKLVAIKRAGDFIIAVVMRKESLDKILEILDEVAKRVLNVTG